MNETFARLRPYDPRGGQPHKDVMNAHLGMKFIAGKFIKLPSRISGKLSEYLKDIYPEGDRSRPCLFQIVSKKEMLNIVKVESENSARKRRAQLLGVSEIELKKIERTEDSRTEVWEDRSEKLEKRTLTLSEELAEDMKVEEEKELDISKIADEADIDSKFDNPWKGVNEELVEEEKPKEKKKSTKKRGRKKKKTEDKA